VIPFPTITMLQQPPSGSVVTNLRATAGDMQSGTDRRVPAGDMQSGSDYRKGQETI
jgi:hypothetical protein